MQNNEDKILFEGLKRQNKNAFDSLFRKYYSRLARFAYKFLLSESSAEEVVQEMFIYLWENAEKTEITTSVSAFLFTSVKNRTLNLIKKEKTRSSYEEDYFGEYINRISEKNSQSPEEIKREIHKGVNTLPEKCKEIFCLSKFEGLSYDEIADYLDISKKTIENQMGIAFKKLREFLGPYLRKT